MNTVSEEQVLFNKLKYDDQVLIINIMKTLQPCEIKEEPRDIEVCGSLFTKSEYDKLAHSEEKKIPEKLNITYEKNCKNNYKWKCEGYNISTPQKLIADKVNSIIDYLKSKGE